MTWLALKVLILSHSQKQRIKAEHLIFLANPFFFVDFRNESIKKIDEECEEKSQKKKTLII